MTLRLRAVHRLCWSALALLLPALWVAALHNIPDPVPGTPVVAMLPPALPEMVGQKESPHFLVNLRSDASNQRMQLEILIKKPLATPALNVYWNDRQVGLLGSKGLYRFPLDPTSRYGTIQFRDNVRHQTVDAIQFSVHNK